LLFATDDQLLTAIHSIGRSPVLRAELGQKGYEGFLRCWCREAHMNSYFAFIEDAARKKLGSVPWLA
jgi:hypothetical protein